MLIALSVHSFSYASCEMLSLEMLNNSKLFFFLFLWLFSSASILLFSRSDCTVQKKKEKDFIMIIREKFSPALLSGLPDQYGIVSSCYSNF